MVHLDDMALFVEVVKLRSFRRAADSLGMPNSTLSRRIGGLEKAIGLRLLHRTTRKIELTEAGAGAGVEMQKLHGSHLCSGGKGRGGPADGENDRLLQRRDKGG